LSDSRGLLKSMLITGSAQVVNILISIVRIKVVAVLLGPSGLGILSIYNSLMGMVQQTAGFGMRSSGIREIALSRDDKATLSLVRRVLFAAHLIQGALAMIAVWLLRERISIWLFGDSVRATEIGMVGIAVFIGLIASAQTALLQGLRKISDLGNVTVIGALIGTPMGLIAVWLQGDHGLIWFLIVQQLALVLAALHYTHRLPKPTAVRFSLFGTFRVWKPMAKLGAAFMLGGLATVATLLFVQSYITKELGLDAAGHFAASWGITMTYVGFLLGAMGADYYPRLTEVIQDKVTAVRLMNDQAQLGLAIAGPILLLLIGLGPWIITLLYSADFGPATTLLQWQTVGNMLKIASWALGYSIVAAGRAKTFLFVELSFNIVYLSMIVLLLPRIGLEVTAYAFVIGYLVHINIVYFVARSIHGFRWEALSLTLLGLNTSLAVALLVLALMAPFAAAVATPLLVSVTGLFGLRVVLSKVGKHGQLPTRLYGIFDRLGWQIQSSD
jgi:O-antigen/teichoic acid export membrane protein